MGWGVGIAQGIGQGLNAIAEQNWANKRMKNQSALQMEELQKRAEMEQAQKQALYQQELEANKMGNMALAQQMGEQIDPNNQESLQYVPVNQFANVLETKQKAKEAKLTSEQKKQGAMLLNKAYQEAATMGTVSPETEALINESGIDMSKIYDSQMKAKTRESERKQSLEDRLMLKRTPQAKVFAPAKSGGGGKGKGSKSNVTEDLGTPITTQSLLNQLQPGKVDLRRS